MFRNLSPKEQETFANKELFRYFRKLKKSTKQQNSFNEKDLNNLPTECNGRIDALWLWVNGTDPTWISKYKKVINFKYDPNKFRDYNTLFYSLRSVKMFAPYIKNYFLVTDNQIPNFLERPLNETAYILKDGEYTLEVVSHQEIIQKEVLPVFSSDNLELHLHNVKNLGECFVYFNDDFILNRPTPLNYFFEDKKAKLYITGKTGSVKLAKTRMWDNSTFHTNTLINRKFMYKKEKEHYFQSHVEYVMRKSILKLIESEFNEEYRKQETKRVREFNSLNIPYLSMHYLQNLELGKYEKQSDLNIYWPLTNQHLNNFKYLMVIKHYEPYSLCLNDRLNWKNETEASQEISFALDWLGSFLTEKFPFEK
ncbi:capsular polysaccharide phosphotransferase fcs1, putative [Entamoeba invadens IP1]|uniref:Capsular polysaccharide phosphotransferase fcs1, putative n=1 Tax=Entamoeba invadens IP1 TaxID=370355 RepID=A0A0A1U122_ENTIV|nr:capsular polysaccharide phosphotransferase fcs1, putative [Entamoeba invadens IP1]ELP86193.1 capsular polysaccharide phosphotransferase fcs1, putative [Entamoeba invadens IP1]|eukprot:XP_004185539.1 capsular polysaccharide phosphotransferase fcs1, putative [Entamoeba invadens IP1]